jgi:hypothetical protein
MKIQLNAAARLMETTEVVAAPSWFTSLNPEMQREYLKRHPDSKLAKDAGKPAPKPKNPAKPKVSKAPADRKTTVQQRIKKIQTRLKQLTRDPEADEVEVSELEQDLRKYKEDLTKL